MGEIIDDQAGAANEPGSAGASEGAFTEPSHDEIKALYEATGVKAPVPTGKPKGRPKADDGGDKKTAKSNNAGGGAGEGQADDDGKNKPKASSASDSDGDDGDDADASGKKVGKKDGKDGEEDSKVSGDGDEDEEGVSDPKSKDNGKTPKSGEDDADEESDGAGQDAGKQGDEEGEDEDVPEGKRPGKSNPEVEKRMQQLTAEKREALERAEKAEKQLQEATRRQEEAKISKEDPEYTIDDFRQVRDREGNIIDLNAEQAELAWRRWKDGYDQRAEERQAKANHAAAIAEREEEMVRDTMKKSVEAYDALAQLQDEYPELVSTSDKYDKDFAVDAMPIIQEAIQYLEGTEPGNPDGNTPVIVGLKINPKKILDALKNANNKKRSLPLNGVNDSVESGSSVSVPHSRSSDPTAKAANELYAHLGIKKRL